jgi:hypothetical protein
MRRRKWSLEKSMAAKITKIANKKMCLSSALGSFWVRIFIEQKFHVCPPGSIFLRVREKRLRAFSAIIVRIRT